VVSKSCTLKKQTGNALPRFISKIDLGPSREGSLNSEGLPNAGVDYYIDPETIKEIGAFGKPYIVSLSGLNLEDNMVMLGRTLASKGVSAIELNLACPNIPGKPVIAYDFDQIEQVLDRLTSHPLFGQKPLGIKLAPYFDKSHVQRVVSILCKYPGIKFITCVNSMGNALFVDADKECECIAPGFGGLGGSYVKQTALANVRMFTCELQAQGRAEVDVVGVGGVFTGRDAFELILCGATAVQVRVLAPLVFVFVLGLVLVLVLVLYSAVSRVLLLLLLLLLLALFFPLSLSLSLSFPLSLSLSLSLTLLSRIDFSLSLLLFYNACHPICTTGWNLSLDRGAQLLRSNNHGAGRAHARKGLFLHFRLPGETPGDRDMNNPNPHFDTHTYIYNVYSIAI
jgi:dihydroorotate dehydrogenase (fumarate)